MRRLILVDGLRFSVENIGGGKVAIRLPDNRYIKADAKNIREELRKHKELRR